MFSSCYPISTRLQITSGLYIPIPDFLLFGSFARNFMHDAKHDRMGDCISYAVKERRGLVHEKWEDFNGGYIRASSPIDSIFLPDGSSCCYPPARLYFRQWPCSSKVVIPWLLCICRHAGSQDEPN